MMRFLCWLINGGHDDVEVHRTVVPPIKVTFGASSVPMAAFEEALSMAKGSMDILYRCKSCGRLRKIHMVGNE